MPSISGELKGSHLNGLYSNNGKKLSLICRAFVTGNAWSLQDDFTYSHFTARPNVVITDVYGEAGAVAETWTLTMTSASAYQATGSISGDDGTGTITTSAQDFTNGKVRFTIKQLSNSTAITIGDTLVIPMQDNPFSGNPDVWVHEIDHSLGVRNGALYKAPGIGSNDDIYIWIRGRGPTTTYTDVRFGTYIDNFLVESNTSFTGGATAALNPNPSSAGVIYPSSDTPMKFWITVNGQRLAVVIQCDGIMSMIYAGFLDSYLLRSEWSYPVYIAGSSNHQGSELWWNTEVQEPGSGWSGDLGLPTFPELGAGHEVYWSGVWRTLQNHQSPPGKDTNIPRQVWPGGRSATLVPADQGGLEHIMCCIPTSPTCLDAGELPATPMFPVLVTSYGTYEDQPGATSIFAQMDGVYCCPGSGAVAGSVITSNGNDYVLFNDHFRREGHKMYALLLD